MPEGNKPVEEDAEYSPLEIRVLTGRFLEFEIVGWEYSGGFFSCLRNVGHKRIRVSVRKDDGEIIDFYHYIPFWRTNVKKRYSLILDALVGKKTGVEVDYNRYGNFIDGIFDSNGEYVRFD